MAIGYKNFPYIIYSFKSEIKENLSNVMYNLIMYKNHQQTIFILIVIIISNINNIYIFV